MCTESGVELVRFGDDISVADRFDDGLLRVDIDLPFGNGEIGHLTKEDANNLLHHLAGLLGESKNNPTYLNVEITSVDRRVREVGIDGAVVMRDPVTGIAYDTKGNALPFPE